MSLLLIVSTSLIILESNAISIVSSTWTDDFAYDIDGINGWNDNNIINGTSKLYHGWYTGNDDNTPSLSRSFQCDQPSHIQLSFIIYFGCNLKYDDELIVSLDGEAKKNIMWDDLENSAQIYNVDEPSAISTCTATRNYGFKGSNQTMIISENPIHGSTTFVIKFEFILSGVANEFEGISDIKIQCIPASSTTTMVEEDVKEAVSDESSWLTWLSLHETLIIAILCILIGIICGIRIAIYVNMIIRRKEERKDSTEQIENNDTSKVNEDITEDRPSRGIVNETGDGFGINDEGYTYQ